MLRAPIYCRGGSRVPTAGIVAGLLTHLEKLIAHSDASPGCGAFLRHPRDEYALEGERELSPRAPAQPGGPCAGPAALDPGSGEAQWAWAVRGGTRATAGPHARELESTGQPPGTIFNSNPTEATRLQAGLPSGAPSNTKLPPKFKSSPSSSQRVRRVGPRTQGLSASEYPGVGSQVRGKCHTRS